MRLLLFPNLISVKQRLILQYNSKIKSDSSTRNGNSVETCAVSSVVRYYFVSGNEAHVHCKQTRLKTEIRDISKRSCRTENYLTSSLPIYLRADVYSPPWTKTVFCEQSVLQIRVNLSV